MRSRCPAPMDSSSTGWSHARPNRRPFPGRVYAISLNAGDRMARWPVWRRSASCSSISRPRRRKSDSHRGRSTAYMGGPCRVRYRRAALPASSRTRDCAAPAPPVGGADRRLLRYYGWLPGPPWLLQELGRSALGPVHWPLLPAPLPPSVGGDGLAPATGAAATARAPTVNSAATALRTRLM